LQSETRQINIEVQQLQEKVLAQQKEIDELKRVQELLIERLEQVA
jgi:hypothetical protein